MDRHLLPDEIDQLLDGDVGPDVAMLEAHVQECARCRSELDGERRLIDAMEHLPRLGPSSQFSAQVMARVHVFEPWHVTLRDSAERWGARLTPSSRPVRVLAGTAAVAVAAVVSVACVWLVTHLGLVFFTVALLRARLLVGASIAGQAVVRALFGDAGLAALGSAAPGAMITEIAMVIVAVLVAVVVVRSAVVVGRRRSVT